METNDTTTKPAPIVSLDGAKIRQIREAKKLTQLYVANVVGVTTDTISRWENNRYPTVKRENAEKLAAAIEAGLDEILLPPEPAPPEDVPQLQQTRSRRPWIGAAAVLAVGAAIITAFFIFWGIPAPIVAERKLPPFAASGTLIPVQIKVERKGGAPLGMVVKERLPRGWKLFRSFPPASGQLAAEEVKWFIPPGSDSVTVGYTAVVPASVTGAATALFAGDVVVGAEGGSATYRVAGDRSTSIAPKHWADRNGDGIIDDNEIMPAYYTTEEMKGLGLDWETIEAIWNSKGYRWDGQRAQFIPVR